MTSPVGRLIWPRVHIYTTANVPPVVCLNRYPRQVIGVGIRVSAKRRRMLCIRWARPSRWWEPGDIEAVR